MALPSVLEDWEIRDWIHLNVPGYVVRGHLPPSVVDVVRYGIHLLKPKTVWLFGSRASGKCRSDSDFDLAFEGLANPEQFGRFWFDAQHGFISLQTLDLVNLDASSSQLKDEVRSQGIRVYTSDGTSN